MKTCSVICTTLLVAALCTFVPSDAQAQTPMSSPSSSKRQTALFAGKDADTVADFFMQRDAAALQALIGGGLDPHETVKGASLPLLCFPTDWPEGIKILGKAGYDLDTICDLDGMKVPTIHAAVSLISTGVIDTEAGLRCLRALIDAGADLELVAEVDANMGASVKCTPLAMALFLAVSGEGDNATVLRVLDALLEAGANPRATVTMGALKLEVPMVVDAWVGDPDIDQAMVQQIRARFTKALNGKAKAAARPRACFAGEKVDSVVLFFMAKDADALRDRLKGGLDPHETVKGASLPLFCFVADWPEGIRILDEAGYNLDTICDSNGMKVPTIHAAIGMIGAGVIEKDAGLRCLRALIDAGADLESRVEMNVGMGAPAKGTPLIVTISMIASGMSKPEVCMEICQLLLDKGADPNARFVMGGISCSALGLLETQEVRMAMTPSSLRRLQTILKEAGAKE